jgi:hypothetical protein
MTHHRPLVPIILGPTPLRPDWQHGLHCHRHALPSPNENGWKKPLGPLRCHATDKGNPRTAESGFPASTVVAQATPCRRTEPTLMKRWKYLWPREPVRLRRGQRVMGTGWVDELTADGTIGWIHLSNGHGRVLIQDSDGIHIWRLNRNLSPEHFRG